MASGSRNFSQNTKEGCQSKESLLEKAHAAMASSQEVHCDWKNSLPTGFRFKPTNKELLDYYLRVKKYGVGIIYDNIIKDLDIYQYEPSQLQNFAYDHGDGKMYFYSPLHRKYVKGERAKRDCPGGYWKLSQKSSTVGDLGTKSALSFYTTEGVKTQWLMHQYRLTDTKHSGQTENPNNLLEEYVLCVVYYKNKSDGDNQSSMPSKKRSSDGDSQNSMPSKKRSSLNLGKALYSHSVSNSVSSPLAKQYQNPHYKPNISSCNNSQMVSYSDPQYNLCPKPTSNPNISIKPNIYPPIYSSHYASSSNYVSSPNHRPAMDIPFSNSRPSTSSHANFFPATNSTMHILDSYHRTQQLKMSPSGASFNPKFNMNPSSTQNSYQPSNSNFHGSHISPMPSTDSYIYYPMNGYHIENPIRKNHYSNLDNTINAEQYPYNNPSPIVVPLSNIITNMGNGMNLDHAFDPNPITSIPNPSANLSMNYGIHPTINTFGPSPSPNPSADLSMRTTANLDPLDLNKQQESSIS